MFAGDTEIQIGVSDGFVKEHMEDQQYRASCSYLLGLEPKEYLRIAMAPGAGWQIGEG
jgi:hypothetical protein